MTAASTRPDAWAALGIARGAIVQLFAFPLVGYAVTGAMLFWVPLLVIPSFEFALRLWRGLTAG